MHVQDPGNEMETERRRMIYCIAYTENYYKYLEAPESESERLNNRLNNN